MERAAVGERLTLHWIVFVRGLAAAYVVIRWWSIHELVLIGACRLRPIRNIKEIDCGCAAIHGNTRIGSGGSRSISKDLEIG